MPSVLPTALLFLLVTAARAATDFSALATLARAELARTGVPGCSVAVIVENQLAYAEGFGVANADTREPVRAEMLFRLGSTTKMFTAAMVVSLALDGRLKLDAPIGGFVSGLAPKIARVTPHRLLSHSAGLGDEAPMEGPHDDSALAARCRALTDQLAFADPGKIYSYSNPGYWLAGLAAETAGGKPYADLVADRVLAPCGMTRSTLRPTMAMTWPLAVGHEGTAGSPARVIRPLADNASTWPAGQLFSSAPEFARFCLALMNGGILDGRQALPAELVTRLTTPHVATAAEGHYGYGLAVRDEGGRRWWTHTGSRAGYGSIARMCPDRGFAVIVLCNRTGEHLPRVADKAAALVLGTAPPPSRAAARTLALTADDRHRLVGTFSNGTTSVVIRERDDQLVGTQGGVFAKTGETRFTRSAVGNTPATEFILTAGLDGTGTYLLRAGRALRKVE